MKKLSEVCYETLSAVSTHGFDDKTSNVEARLRYVLQILPKPLRIEYVDHVWSNLRTTIGWKDDDTVISSDNADDEVDGETTKSVTKLIDWYDITERVIKVVSEFIRGYGPTKRFPKSGVKREGCVTIVWWDTNGVRSYCHGYRQSTCICGRYIEFWIDNKIYYIFPPSTSSDERRQHLCLNK